MDPAHLLLLKWQSGPGGIIGGMSRSMIYDRHRDLLYLGAADGSINIYDWDVPSNLYN